MFIETSDAQPEAAHRASRIPAAAVAAHDVWCVPTGMSARALLDAFLRRGVSGVVVVDIDGRPLGVVSKTDLLREVEQRCHLPGCASTPDVDELYTLQADPLARVTAGEIMTPALVTADEHATLAQVAGLMAFEGVHRVPVVAGDGRVIGILSSLDVARWVAREAGYLTVS